MPCCNILVKLENLLRVPVPGLLNCNEFLCNCLLRTKSPSRLIANDWFRALVLKDNLRPENTLCDNDWYLK